MCNKIIFIIVIICLSNATGKLHKRSLNIPDYDFHKTRETNLRNNFLEKRKQNRMSEKRIKILDMYLLNNTVYLDGIVHYEISRSNSKLRRINEIENEFKRIIGMRGVKYLYKRDAYWRTWREVDYANGDKNIVCYRCNNVIKSSNSSCQGGGYWIIEEKPPPCPFEIFSIINEDKLCAVNYTQFHDKYMRNSCPTVIKFADLSETCDNPIETKWIIRRDYKAVSERNPAIMCNGRENCEMTTVYAITPEQVSFRIMNSSNVVIYSKVMKNGGKNYACVDECGQLDPDGKTINKQEKPLTVNLLGLKPRKNKRDNYFVNKHFLPINITAYQSKQDPLNVTKTIIGGKIRKIFEKTPSNMDVHRNTAEQLSRTTISNCKRLEKAEDEDSDGNETSDY